MLSNDSMGFDRVLKSSHQPLSAQQIQYIDVQRASEIKILLIFEIFPS